MAVQGEGSPKGEIKTQFSTIEGVYKLLPVPEYSRPNRVAYNNSGGCTSSPLVRMSFICLPEQKINGHITQESNCVDNNGMPNVAVNSERTNICYNYGRDLYVYSYRGAKKDKEIPKPIEKRSYSKEDIPTCHDFNITTASDERVSLLVGLLGGQIQLFDPITKDLNKTYNSGERLIDKSKVTCLRWIPDSPNRFLASHSSGHMYLYSEELVCGLDKPIYQTFKQGEGYCVYTCKTKSTRNPLYRWSIGEGSINEFSFSPCYKYLATVSQDGFLRVFNFDTMDLVGSARSYYGGLLCVCWSPDGKYVVTGGEDDLVTVWSFKEKRVVCRGRGHMSWVTVVAFDPYTTIFAECTDAEKRLKNVSKGENNHTNSTYSNHDLAMADSLGIPVTSYRLGTVGQDTLLCLWDLKEDVLMQPYYRPRSSTIISSSKSSGSNTCTSNNILKTNHKSNVPIENINHSYTSNSFSSKLANLNFGEKKDKIDRDHKRSLSLSTKNSLNKNSSSKNQVGNMSNKTDLTSRVIGTQMCPNLDECTILEPMVCKKIGIERLTGLVFRQDCIVTSCQDGCILTWCRPGKQVHNYEQGSGVSNTVHMGGSQNSSNGTVV